MLAPRPVVLKPAIRLSKGEQPLVDEQCRQGKSGQNGSVNLEKDWSEGWHGGPVSERPSAVGGLLELSRGRSGRRVPAGDDWERSSGASPGVRTANIRTWYGQGETALRTTAKGTGLAESAGKRMTLLSLTLGPTLWNMTERCSISGSPRESEKYHYCLTLFYYIPWNRSGHCPSLVQGLDFCGS
ncbi:hypothetical protein CTI12_AA312810 [Artemisia annua]|uniref:Uncharacterized protein n=1 Tax=Artemisia annua TaxID=35608 RepID=A0A2U1N3J5_ARTAN|nr:hypothetical protein CTI12_AA312810 [Artemisia annua]